MPARTPLIFHTLPSEGHQALWQPSWTQTFGVGAICDACDYFVKNDVSSDTLENKVFEQDAVKVKTDTEKRMC